jgi:hypothetical protein
MMTDHKPRLFTSDAEIERVGEALLARTLPRPDWTHEAHLAATTYLISRRPDIDIDAALPGIIRAYNESVGGVNDDTQGYHETITRVFLHGVRLFLGKADPSEPLHELVNELLLSPMGRRDWPVRFYSAEQLSSVEARRHFVPPEIAALPSISPSRTGGGRWRYPWGRNARTGGPAKRRRRRRRPRSGRSRS